MNWKSVLKGSVLASILALPTVSSANINECMDGFCKTPSLRSSGSQFFKEDVNDVDQGSFDDLAKPEDLVAIPIEGKFWPVQGIITGTFGTWRGGRRGGHVHAGVDIAASHGKDIVAPISGKVAFVGHKGGYGNTVILDHGNGITTLYGHTSKIHVAEGQRVRKGELIADVGSTGHSTGPHLHYEVRLEGKPVNPLAWTNRLQSDKIERW